MEIEGLVYLPGLVCAKPDEEVPVADNVPAVKPASSSFSGIFKKKEKMQQCKNATGDNI